MLDKLLKPFTTATATGVAVRDLTVIIGAVLAILGILGWLSDAQVEAIKQQVAVLTDPALLASLGTLMAAGMSIYRIFFKSTSDKAAEVAKEVDQKMPADATVRIETPAGQEDIVVHPK